jgi:hypothetical protein
LVVALVVPFRYDGAVAVAASAVVVVGLVLIVERPAEWGL